jgi:uncharacterized protein (DUF58 family)
LKLTRAGALYIIITLLLGFAAVNTGNNLLYLVVAALLGFMAVSGLAGKSNLDGVEIDFTPPDEVYDGIPTLLRVRLRNRRRFWPLFLLRVELFGFATNFAVIGGGEERSEPLPLTLSGRGRKQVRAVRIASRFPVNFFVRSRHLPLAREIVVFPAPHPYPGEGAASGGRRDGERPSPRRGLQGEVARITDYSGREPLKQVHWKLSARQDALKVKEYAAATCDPLLVELEALPGDLETRLRTASFLVNRAARQGRPVGLRLAGRHLAPDSGTAHKLRLLRELALYGHD